MLRSSTQALRLSVRMLRSSSSGQHCVDLAKVQTQQGRLLFLISSVKPVPKRRSMTVQPVSERRYMTVKQPSWQEITRHRLGKGANLKKLKNLKLNFEFGSEISPPRGYCAEQPNAMSSGKLRGNRLASDSHPRQAMRFNFLFSVHDNPDISPVTCLNGEIHLPAATPSVLPTNTISAKNTSTLFDCIVLFI